MKKGNIFFRADGDSTIGLGHLVRCIALAQMLEKDFEIEFVCKKIPENIIHDLKENGFGLLIIRKEEEFLVRLNKEAIVVLDHYGLDSVYQKKVKGICNKLVCIDDINDKEFFADLIINHAPDIDALDYSAQTYTQFALGLDFVLLRPVFLNKVNHKDDPHKVRTAFVCFGGSDSKNITQLVVDILLLDKRFDKIIVVTGSAYNNLSRLKQSVADDVRFNCYHSIDSVTMCDLIMEAQLAIVPASGILQEVIAVGNHIISGMYIENQKNIFDKYKALGAFESAGDFSQDELIEAINRTFEKQPLQHEKFIDGKSGMRLVNVFKQLEKEDLLVLREAEESDLDCTFRWAGDKTIRAFAFNKQEISFSDHSNWFLKKINSDTCYYFIAILNDTAVGSIRFDIESDSAVISYLLDSSCHNQGLGIVLLKKGFEELKRKNNLKIKTVTGFVVPQNIASVKSFERLGYEKMMDNGNLKFIKEIGT